MFSQSRAATAEHKAKRLLLCCYFSCTTKSMRSRGGGGGGWGCSLVQACFTAVEFLFVCFIFPHLLHICRPYLSVSPSPTQPGVSSVCFFFFYLTLSLSVLILFFIQTSRLDPAFWKLAPYCPKLIWQPWVKLLHCTDNTQLAKTYTSLYKLHQRLPVWLSRVTQFDIHLSKKSKQTWGCGMITDKDSV